ncbi:hypothetical protein Golob_027557 [Gossypium lobatum]|uniref:Uncharacterized protein n=1 Tax=Gossypium lobatum TaxID=34289 RepID=A0A7J8NG00_9ROSI|nr:hypothetical protein [Gossypium lobatum]
MKKFTANSMTTPEYDWWWRKRANDNVPLSKIIKQDFEKKSSELGKKIEQLKEEKIQLGLDVDVHKLEAEKMRKG